MNTAHTREWLSDVAILRRETPQDAQSVTHQKNLNQEWQHQVQIITTPLVKEALEMQQVSKYHLQLL